LVRGSWTTWLRWALAAVMLAAGASKLVDAKGLVLGLVVHSDIGAVQWGVSLLERTVPMIEVLVGVGLLSRKLLAGAALLGAVLSTGFTCLAFAIPDGVECSCFGVLGGFTSRAAHAGTALSMLAGFALVGFHARRHIVRLERPRFHDPALIGCHQESSRSRAGAHAAGASRG
jgi:predicted anti-sigma-YlaC factor YlaD